MNDPQLIVRQFMAGNLQQNSGATVTNISESLRSSYFESTMDLGLGGRTEINNPMSSGHDFGVRNQAILPRGTVSWISLC